MEEPFATRSVAGRLIALELRPTRPLTLLGPAWAVLCGAIAAGGLAFRAQSILVLILSLLLCDVLLGAWRALWLDTGWRIALQRASVSAHTWLSTFEDAPVSWRARLARRFTRRLAFARSVSWPLIESDIVGMLMAGVLALSVAAVLGLVPFTLTALAMLFALIEGKVGARHRDGWRALVEVMLPWLIAQGAFGYFSWLAFVFAVLFTLVYRAHLGLALAQDKWTRWTNLAQLAVALILIASNMPVGAGVVALGLLAQVLGQARYRVDRDGRMYAPRAQSYVLVAMLVAACSLWL